MTMEECSDNKLELRTVLLKTGFLGKQSSTQTHTTNLYILPFGRGCGKSLTFVLVLKTKFFSDPNAIEAQFASANIINFCQMVHSIA